MCNAAEKTSFEYVSVKSGKLLTTMKQITTISALYFFRKKGIPFIALLMTWIALYIHFTVTMRLEFLRQIWESCRVRKMVLLSSFLVFKTGSASVCRNTNEVNCIFGTFLVFLALRFLTHQQCNETTIQWIIHQIQRKVNYKDFTKVYVCVCVCKSSHAHVYILRIIFNFEKN